MRWLAPLAIASLPIGCADTGTSPPPNVVFALLDPSATPPQIPLPNDLTMMPAPPASPAVASFSGPLDPSTLRPDDVIVLDLTTMLPLTGAQASFDAQSDRLAIAPPGGAWPAGHRIAIVLRGGDTGLKGTGGIPVVASPAFYFARGTMPVSNCTMPAPSCTSASPEVLPVEQAIGLERLRQAFAPLLTTLAATGVPREQVVLAWTFTVGAPASAGPLDAGAVSDGG